MNLLISLLRATNVCSTFLIINILFLGLASANSVNSQTEFQHGIEKFKKKDYSAALAHFLRAREAGLNQSKLIYNIGVTYYKLEQYQKAYQELIFVTRDPALASSAHLNAGFAAGKLGNRTLAKHQFNKAIASAQSKKQKQLAERALKELDSNLPKIKVKSWRLNFQANLGHNDNVILESNRSIVRVSNQNSTSIDKFDNYYSLFGFAGINLSKFSSVELSAYKLDYFKLNEYDFGRANIRINFFKNTTNSGLKLSGDYDTSWLGGYGFQTIKTLSLNSHHQVWAKGFFDARFSYSGITSKQETQYKYLDGNLQHLQFKLWHMPAPFKKLGLTYHFEHNDRQDYYDKYGFLHSSFSPIRHRIGIFTQIPIIKTSWLTLNADYTDSRYPTVTRMKKLPDGMLGPGGPIDRPVVENPGNIIILEDGTVLVEEGEITRRDTRATLNAVLYFRLSRYLLLNVNYMYLNNRSNVALYSYISNRVSAGVMLNF